MDACPRRRPRVVAVTVGLPGAGKSTLCRRLCAQARALGAGRVEVVELDAVEEDLLAEAQRAAFDAAVWHQAREKALARVEATLADDDEARSGEETPLYVLVDDNMYYQSMRAPFRQLAQRAGAGYLEIFVECGLDEALRRNADRDAARRVPQSVLQRMLGRLEPPTSGRRSVNASSEGALEDVLAALVLASESPETNSEAARAIEAAASRAAVNANSSHQRELALRAAVRDFVQSVPGPQRRDAAQVAARVKAEFAARESADTDGEDVAQTLTALLRSAFIQSEKDHVS